MVRQKALLMADQKVGQLAELMARQKALLMADQKVGQLGDQMV
jgi:hypothetical protein